MSTTFLLETWSALQQSPTALSTVALGAGVLLIIVVSWLYPPRKNGIRELGGFSVLTAWPFFSRRFDFLKNNFSKVGEDMFSFNILQHKVTATRGHEARAAFFDSKSLNFSEGYKILMGSAPRLDDIGEQPQPGQVSWFVKHLNLLMNKQRLTEVIPTLLDDIQERMEEWGKEGFMDPFKDVYDLVFQMTVRMATCRELAADIAEVTSLQKEYWALEKSSTPTSLLLPWFPSKSKKNKERATRNLYHKLHDYVKRRRAADVPSADAFDILIAKGLSDQDIIGFVLNIIFAGVVNTGVNSCWALLFLSFHKDWKAKVLTEVHALIETHTNTVSNEPLHKRLSAIPISVWEDEMPVTDTIIRETLRLTINGAAIRRNIVGDVKVSGKTLPAGNFVVYPLADAHLNPEIYPNPTVFDPNRYQADRQEDKKHTFGFLGWGAGRHPCAGMKVAKLEIKIILALFLAAYEYDVVDAAGNFPDRLPVADLNDIQQARPIGKPVFIKYKRVAE